MKFGDVLRELLEEHCISQKQAAHDLNLAASTLGNYVRNIREPDYETLRNIANYFNVTIDYLLGHYEKGICNHEEEHLLEIFRNLSSRQKDLFIEQGKLLMKYDADNESR